MPDIYMNHGSLAGANDELQQAQTTMTRALEDFISQLHPHLDNTEGDLKVAWTEVQTKVNNTSGRAHGAMQSAVTALHQIQEETKQGDRQGAVTMGA